MAKPAVLTMISGASTPTVSNTFVNNNSEICTLQISGTFASATVKVEGIVDINSGRWVSLATFDLTDLDLKTNGMSDKSLYRVGIAGILRVRISLTAINGGDITVMANFVDTEFYGKELPPSSEAPFTAYDLAVLGGYTGTQADYEAALADIVEAVPLSQQMAGIAQEAAERAASSATYVQNYAVSASNSASNAGISATNAAESASDAASSASAASGSATAAANSATGASSSASSAENSAVNASISSSNAAVSASNAATSASGAAGSAANASSSAANASSSAASAANSAANAADSATRAATSATSAQNAVGAIAPAIVTEWLDENVNPVGSAVVVDSSLSISGAAADAKITGDFRTAFNTILNPDTFQPTINERTYIDNNDGKIKSSAGGYCTSSVYNGYGYRAAVILDSNTYEYKINYYNSGYDLSSGAGYANLYTDYRTGLTYLSNAAPYFVMTFRRIDQATLSSTDFTAILAALSCYRATDSTLTKSGIAADAKVVGNYVFNEEIVTNGLHSLVNYGYDTSYDYAENPSILREKIGIKRNKMVVLLNKSSTSQYNIRVKLTGAFGFAANNSEVDAWGSGIILKADHEYRATIKLLSGTCYYTTLGDGYVPSISIYKAGEHAAQGTSKRNKESYSYSRTFVAEENVQYNLALYFDADHYYCTNAEFIVTLEDCTESEIANVENEVSEINETISNISSNLDYLFYTEGIEFSVSDWRTGYYGSSSGNFTQSYLYICTANGYSIGKSNATRLTAKAPAGYFIAAFEYDSNGTYIQRHGNQQTTNEIEANFVAGHYFRLSVGRFAGNTAADYLTSEFIGQIEVSIDEVKFPDDPVKKERTGDFEFFTVTVDRPLAFGGEDVIDPQAAEEIECVLRLPASYRRTGKPTRLVLACHGAHGYIVASMNKWYNDNWKAFMDTLLAAGYAVFDSNIFPTSTGSDQMGFAVGSPLYINVLKKAYDYIQMYYNVYPEIFAHGTSMGGVGASAFSHAYPHLVLAESSFAGRDFLYYINSVKQSSVSEAFAVSYGYNSLADLASDKFSHCEGAFQCLSLVKYVNGVAQIPPDRDTNYQDWLTYFSQIANLGRNDDAGIWMGERKVPYKAWNSWADNEGATKLQTILQKAYNRGNSCPYYVINYESGSHSQMSYGEINDMIPQLIAWYKRWE